MITQLKVRSVIFDNTSYQTIDLDKETLVQRLGRPELQSVTKEGVQYLFSPAGILFYTATVWTKENENIYLARVVH